jgi:hypothetical protein
VGALVLTGNRAHQREQLFCHFAEKRCLIPKKRKLERFFTKIATNPQFHDQPKVTLTLKFTIDHRNILLQQSIKVTLR